MSSSTDATTRGGTEGDAPSTSPLLRFLPLALAAAGAFLVAQTLTQELLTAGGSFGGAELALRLAVGAVAIALGLVVSRVAGRRVRTEPLS